MAAEAYSARGTVVPSKNAAFESLMVAVKRVLLKRHLGGINADSEALVTSEE